MTEEMESPDIFKVFFLTAMRALQRILNLLPAAVVSSCWKHTGLIGVTYVSVMDVINPPA